MKTSAALEEFTTEKIILESWRTSVTGTIRSSHPAVTSPLVLYNDSPFQSNISEFVVNLYEILSQRRSIDLL